MTAVPGVTPTWLLIEAELAERAREEPPTYEEAVEQTRARLHADLLYRDHDTGGRDQR